MEMRSPRTARISSSLSVSRSRPSNSTRPDTMRPGGEAIKRRMESEVTLLPHPDSPTTASVSPGATENETPSTARTTPSRVKKWVLRLSISRSGAMRYTILHLDAKTQRRKVLVFFPDSVCATSVAFAAPPPVIGSHARFAPLRRRFGIKLHPPRQPRIERIAHPVSEQIHREHAHPELAFEEARTSERVAQQLSA